MCRPLIGIALITTLLWGISAAHGQNATEIFIPLGQSPGLSHKYTYVGTIDKVNKQQRTITAGGHAIKITSKTKIWLDRTKLKLSNQIGSFADLKVGGKVEVKYDDPARREVAEWVKAQVSGP